MSVRILVGDALARLRGMPDESVHCCVTSPPYFGLRDYGVDGQIGLEESPEAFVARLVEVFAEVRRVLRADGTCWVNLGDSYANDGKWGGATSGKHVSGLHGQGGVGRGKRFTGLKPKDLVGIPWRVAFALQADGWWLRSDIIWGKPNPMPESVTDRPTKAHEYVFLLTKSARYWYDAGAIAEPGAEPDRVRRGEAFGGKNGASVRHGAQSVITGSISTRNARSVWTIAIQPFPGSHFATMPPSLAERCILAGCPSGGTVLDPFGGAGTTGLVADRLQRDAVLIELNPGYARMAERRIRDASPLLSDVEVIAA